MCERREGAERPVCSRLESGMAKLLVELTPRRTICGRQRSGAYDDAQAWRFVFAHGNQEAMTLGPAVLSYPHAGEHSDTNVIGRRSARRGHELARSGRMHQTQQRKAPKV